MNENKVIANLDDEEVSGTVGLAGYLHFRYGRGGGKNCLCIKSEDCFPHLSLSYYDSVSSGARLGY